ncbi:hypothetical protein RRG08_025874 [Elysia crispata]|uniref:Uncharacterized protein n=1 Tax=Elysia crispata TaxID=231223 RepID=A0AAE0ZQ23_9GAST|nr:hypothetical protein RRG08_025874 [Elysia crispata]
MKANLQSSGSLHLCKLLPVVTADGGGTDNYCHHNLTRKTTFCSGAARALLGCACVCSCVSTKIRQPMVRYRPGKNLEHNTGQLRDNAASLVLEVWSHGTRSHSDMIIGQNGRLVEQFNLTVK